jgi:uncharacterized protein GlcG (DUF336 family)
MQNFVFGAAKALGSLALLASFVVADTKKDGVAAATSPALITTRTALALDGAHLALHAALDKARALGTTGSIAIVDAGGHLLAFGRIDGSFAGSSEVAIGKARTAALFEKPTANFEEIIRNGRTPMLALEHFTPLKGGLPLRVGDQVVGGVGVSGAASADQDEELATIAAAALMAAKP